MKPEQGKGFKKIRAKHEVKTSKTTISKRKRKPVKKRLYQNIAKLRILELFNHAEKIYKVDPSLADIAVRHAWRLKLKYKVKLPDSLRLRFCKKCLSYWVLGETVRKRIVKGKAVYTCLKCGRVYRRVLKK